MGECSYRAIHWYTLDPCPLSVKFFPGAMDYIEEEARPRFLFQARSSVAAPSAADKPPETLIKTSRIHAAVCFSAAVALLLLSALFLSHHQALSFILIWTSLSLLTGPFAPPSLTGGDPRVGLGDPLPAPLATSPQDFDEPNKRITGRRPRSRASDPPPPPFVPIAPVEKKPAIFNGRKGSDPDVTIDEWNHAEKEWTDEDFEVLKKQIAKHPVGAPKRWERIAEAFWGRHGLESVIRTGKSLSEKRPVDGDSYAQFLKQRKPMDKRSEAVDGESVQSENGVSKGASWSSAEDIALLNALKAFPKDVSMRWEKVAAAVPGKSKACCMKRITELKKDFRCSKASES